MAINKVDMLEVRERLSDIVGSFKKEGVKVVPISALSGEGINELMRYASGRLEAMPREAPGEGFKVFHPRGIKKR